MLLLVYILNYNTYTTYTTSTLLSLNADKTHYMQFATKTSSLIDLHLMCKNKEIANTCNIKFLGLTLDNTFSWKNHIEAIGGLHCEQT
jgi:hypothetical protein